VRRYNVNDAEFQYDEGDPEGYNAGYARIGPLINAAMLGATVYELRAGQSICPYHYEYGNEEWLFVLDGTPTLRHPEGEDALRSGDVVCFPVGPDGAHKLTNVGDGTAHLVIFSTKHDPSVAVYPDSDKLGVWTGDERDRLLARRESNVDYWDGEI
jgi:uncharacterized cupin superfamily protein